MANYYIYIYLTVLGLIIFQQITLPEYSSPFRYGNNAKNSIASFFLMMACTLFIGLRPVDNAFADMVNYYYDYMHLLGAPFDFDSSVYNKIFDNILPLFASLRLPSEIFFTFIALIYFGAMYIACKKIFPNNLFVSYLACLTAFSTFSYGTNGIKAGAAASIFLVSLAYHDRKWLSIILALISWGFHHSMSMVLVAYVISYFVKNTKFYFYVWVVCVFLAIAHVSSFQIFFAGWTDEKGAAYLLTNEDSFLTGFRPDFILYSAMPVLIGYWMKFKKNIQDENYELWLRMYLVTNSVWMLCMYASFTNRIAYLSWFMYPVVLIYPFFSMKWSDSQTIYAKRTIMYHYAFTLFMAVIYYTFIKYV